MSLVHEALRKAEREKQRKTGAAPSAPPSPHQTAPPQSVHLPAPHAPVLTMPAAPRHMDAPPSAPTPEKPPETNHFLLPALIGCVAIVAIIAIVFLVSNASSVLRQPRESTPVAAATTPPALAPAPVATPSVPAEPQPAAQPRNDSATPPNVQPPATPAIDESKYKLSGIMKDPDGKSVAVLNGRVVYEGYFIDGATVEKIGPDRVTLDVNGQKVVRRLF